MTEIGHFSLVVVELMAATAAMVVADIQYDCFSAKAGIHIGAIIIKRCQAAHLVQSTQDHFLIIPHHFDEPAI
jgi:hypothetical protein